MKKSKLNSNSASDIGKAARHRAIADSLANHTVELLKNGALQGGKIDTYLRERGMDNTWLERLGLAGEPVGVSDQRTLNDTKQLIAQHLFDALDMEAVYANPYAFVDAANVNGQSVMFTIHPSFILTALSLAPLPGKSSVTPMVYNADASGKISPAGAAYSQPGVDFIWTSSDKSPLLGMLYQMKAVNTMSGIVSCNISHNGLILDLQQNDVNVPGLALVLNPGSSVLRAVTGASVDNGGTTSVDTTITAVDTAILNEWNWNPQRAFGKGIDTLSAVNCNLTVWPIFNTIGIFDAVIGSIVSDAMPELTDNILSAAAQDLGLKLRS